MVARRALFKTPCIPGQSTPGHRIVQVGQPSPPPAGPEAKPLVASPGPIPALQTWAGGGFHLEPGLVRPNNASSPEPPTVHPRAEQGCKHGARNVTWPPALTAWARRGGAAGANESRHVAPGTSADCATLTREVIQGGPEAPPARPACGASGGDHFFPTGARPSRKTPSRDPAALAQEPRCHAASHPWSERA
jgi:hypothetical protein